MLNLAGVWSICDGSGEYHAPMTFTPATPGTPGTEPKFTLRDLHSATCLT